LFRFFFGKPLGCCSVDGARTQYHAQHHETRTDLVNAEQRVAQLEHLNELLVAELANRAAAAAPQIEQVVDGHRTCGFVHWFNRCGLPLAAGETDFCAMHN